MTTMKPLEGQQATDLIRDAATNDSAAILERLQSAPTGLTEEEAAERLEVFGPNEVGQEKKTRVAAPAVGRRPQPAGDSADRPVHPVLRHR